MVTKEIFPKYNLIDKVVIQFQLGYYNKKNKFFISIRENKLIIKSVSQFLFQKRHAGFGFFMIVCYMFSFVDFNK